MTFCNWNLSAQSPILVNRGWVPRSWKDKSCKHPVDDEPLAIESPTSGESRSSWRWFQSNKPDIVQVVFTFITFLLYRVVFVYLDLEV